MCIYKLFTKTLRFAGWFQASSGHQQGRFSSERADRTVEQIIFAIGGRIPAETRHGAHFQHATSLPASIQHAKGRTHALVTFGQSLRSEAHGLRTRDGRGRECEEVPTDQTATLNRQLSDNIKGESCNLILFQRWYFYIY